ncbi:class I SAM-dependent methyltransferase [soil metagenome]
MKADWWDGYFDETFVELYRAFLTPERTRREVRGLLKLLEISAGGSVLDLACGWGRHSVELARRGYAVTGLDWSATLLEHARRRSRRAGVDVEWVQADMRELPWTGRFDVVLSLFSSLGYFLSDAEDLRVLRAARQSLRPGGHFVLETMHRDHVVVHYTERDWWEAPGDMTAWVEREWDALAGVSHETLRWRREELGGEKQHAIRIRTATEWLALIAEAGLEPVDCYGDWDETPFTHTSENLVILAKPRG